MKKLGIFFDPDLENNMTKGFKNELKAIFNFKIEYVKQQEVPSHCINTIRKQIIGKCLLNFAIENQGEVDFSLFITSKDCYTNGLNFIFGQAKKFRGCIVSTNRLGKDRGFLVKECVHELGHVLGLTHCSIPCVMTFSNSVYEARQKNRYFCQGCKNQITNFLQHNVL